MDEARPALGSRSVERQSDAALRLAELIDAMAEMATALGCDEAAALLTKAREAVASAGGSRH